MDHCFFWGEGGLVNFSELDFFPFRVCAGILVPPLAFAASPLTPQKINKRKGQSRHREENQP